MKRFQRGIDFKEKDDDYKSFTIHDLKEDWEERIVVYGDSKLRNLIVRLLNQYETKQFNKQIRDIFKEI